MTHKECIDLVKRCNPSLYAYDKAIEILYCSTLDDKSIYPIITAGTEPYGVKIQFKGFDFRVSSLGTVGVTVEVPSSKDALEIFIKTLRDYYLEWE